MDVIRISLIVLMLIAVGMNIHAMITLNASRKRLEKQIKEYENQLRSK